MRRMVVRCCGILDKWSSILWHMAFGILPVPSLRLAHSDIHCKLHWLRPGFLLLRSHRVSTVASCSVLLALLVCRMGSSICDVEGGPKGREREGNCLALLYGRSLKSNATITYSRKGQLGAEDFLTTKPRFWLMKFNIKEALRWRG